MFGFTLLFKVCTILARHVPLTCRFGAGASAASEVKTAWSAGTSFHVPGETLITSR